jgi:hypothetical protein
MSRFQGFLRGETTRLAVRNGNQDSGIFAQVRGYHIGAKVYMDVNKEGKEVLTVMLTCDEQGWCATKSIEYTVPEVIALTAHPAFQQPPKLRVRARSK